MVLNRDQELWAVALWVEKNHGKRDPRISRSKSSGYSTKGTKQA